MSSAAIKKRAAPLARPDIYAYHDYREFLRELLQFLKYHKRLSTRKIARQSGIGESYISMVVSGERSLSAEHLEKLAIVLELERSEVAYLERLIEIDAIEDSDEKFEALKKIQRFRGYQNVNSAEIVTHRYLEHWYHVAIREMADLPEFNADPKWIQKALRFKVGLTEIKTALEFLLENGLLVREVDGRMHSSGQLVQCKSGVLKPALVKFHSEMLELAVTSLTEVPSLERNVSAFTAAIPVGQMDQVRAILEEARRKISDITKNAPSPDTIFHFGFLAIPLTKKSGEE